MKKLLLLFLMMIALSCSKEEGYDSFSIVLKTECPETENTVYKEYCVSEDVYNEFMEHWEKVVEKDISCYVHSFTDLNGDEISGYFRTGSASYETCDGVVPNYLK